MGRVIKFLFLLAVLAGIVWIIWQKTLEEPVKVAVRTVDRGPVEATVANTRAGTVEACRRAHLSPSLGGQIETLPHKEGTRVSKGTVLMSLWNEDLQADIVLAAEQLVASQADKLAVCQEAEEAARQTKRIEQLAKSNNISDAAVDEAQAKRSVSEARCKAAEGQVKVAKSKLNAVETRLKKTYLLAPFEGVIAQINGELNEYVTPSPPGILTPPVIDLIEPGCFKMSAPIDEVDASRISVGMPARITLDAWRDREFAGKVQRIGDYIVDVEKQARTVEVELSFESPEDLADLRVGYSADVDIITDASADVVRIPSEALLDANHVLQFDPADQRLHLQAIEKGLGNWVYTEVVSGLAVGDQVVITLGAEGVEDGALAVTLDQETR